MKTLLKEEIEVSAFMRAATQATPELPVMPPDDVRLLRVKLIIEEALELAAAYGVKVTVMGDVTHFHLEEPANEIPEIDRLTDAYDAVLDLKVVVVGTGIAQGTQLAEGWDAVHASNMAKFGPGGYRRPDGKWMKPPGWQKPDLKSIILRQLGQS